MPNRLDEISRVIGNIEAEVRGLTATVAEVRQSSAEHHRENRERLETISTRVEKIESDMKPLAKTVATMEPIVAGYAVTRWRSRFSDFLDVIAMTPFAVAGTVLAIGLVISFNTGWLVLTGGWLILVLAWAVRKIPFNVRSASAILHQIDPSLEEASVNLGVSPAMTFLRLTLPLMMANLIAGTILTFSLAMLEVSDGLILAMKESFYPITKMIWLLLGRIDPNAAGVACALGVVGMVILSVSLVAASRLLGRRLGQLFRS